MTAWRLETIGFSIDDIRIDGLSVWKHKWRSVEIEPILRPHPSYPNQIHRYDVYEIGDATLPVRFAASELSNGVWAFYVPVETSN
jgi:hypothetical protein